MLKANTKNISIVLQKPKYAGNIGSIARAAKNMGIGNIIVVGAADMDREEMQKRSTHLAADVLDKIQYFQNIGTALENSITLWGQRPAWVMPAGRLLRRVLLPKKL